MTLPPPHPTAQALGRAGFVLFDFDGPLCALFAAPPAPHGSLAPGIAEELKDILGEYGLLRAPLRACRDPHALYRATPPGPASVALRKHLDDAETRAAETATATPGAAALVSALRAAGRRLAVASNNSEAAIRRYLARTGLDRLFDGPVAGRADDPALMKPDPDCLNRAMAGLGAAPADCLMIGDSPADVAAARAAGVAFCGYGTDEAKRARLCAAGADPRLIVGDLGILGAALREARGFPA